MNTTTIVVSVSLITFATFAYGMAAVFRLEDRRSVRTRAVAVAGAVAAGVQLAALVASRPTPLVAAAAVGLDLLALTLFFWALSVCRGQPLTAIYQRDAPRHLVTTGPYRFLRHPFYTSYGLCWLAGGIASDSWLALVAATAMVSVYVHAATTEAAKFRHSPLATAHAEHRARTSVAGSVGRLWQWLRGAR